MSAARSSEQVALLVCGAAGRMGRRIIALAHADPRFRVAAAIEAAGHPDIGADAGEIAGIGRLGIAIGSDLAKQISPAVVTVDFTTAEASLVHLRAAARAKAPIVVGSTGGTPEQRDEARRLAREMPTLIAPNMSVGVNVLISLVEDAVRRLGPEFDCEIFEIHHGLKKDSPSGTALALAEAAASAAGVDPAKAIRPTRAGMVGERPQGEIGVFGLRGGDVVGDHTVLLMSTGERIELVHRATSRDCLATGALKAAAWLCGRPAGLYSMRDVVLAAPAGTRK